MQEARQIFTQLDDLDKEDMNMNHKTNTKGTDERQQVSLRSNASAGRQAGWENKLETL